MLTAKTAHRVLTKLQAAKFTDGFGIESKTHSEAGRF